MKNLFIKIKIYLKGFKNLNKANFEYNEDLKVIKFLNYIEHKRCQHLIKKSKSIAKINNIEDRRKKAAFYIKQQNKNHENIKTFKNFYLQLIQIKYI